MTVDLINSFTRAKKAAIRSAVLPLMLAALGCTAPGNLIRAQDVSTPHQDAERLRQAGLIQAASGHIDDAIATFEKGLAVEPANAALLDAIGAAYTLKGQLETAGAYFVKSLEADPDSVITRQNLGIVLFSQGRYDDAALHFTRLRDVPGKTHSVAGLFLGLIAQRRSDCRKAIPLMEASGELLYSNPDALLSYAECENVQGNSARVNEALAGFRKLSGSTPEQRRRADDLDASMTRKKDAHEETNAQSRNPDATDSALRQAAALEKANHLDEAQKILERAAAGRPAFNELFELAEVAKQRGDFAVAMKALKQASKIEPGREDSYLEFSSICADHGNDQLALDAANIGLDHVPGSYRLTVQKGVVQDKLGHFTDAEETLRKAIGMQKDNSIALVSLAVVQAHGGMPVEAEDTLASAIRQFPDNYYMHYFRGKLLLQIGDGKTDVAERRETARRSLEKAIELNPKYADSYYQISQVYLDTSAELAEQALRKCLELDSTHIAAQYALARLLVRTGRRDDGQALFTRLKSQQRATELEQQKQLRIEVAQN